MLNENNIKIEIREKEGKHEINHRDLALDAIITSLKEEYHTENNDAKRRGIVVFAHGSGSGRKSPSNQYVASVMHNAGFGTLLVDLLTSEEQKIDERTREYRFNIRLLANRLLAVTDWLLTKNKET